MIVCLYDAVDKFDCNHKTFYKRNGNNEYNLQINYETSYPSLNHKTCKTILPTMISQFITYFQQEF